VPDTDPAVSAEDNASGVAQVRTFLLADVRGYTLFTQERGDEAAAALAAKFADIAREIVEARGGTLLELRGDEALCVFVSTREAIRAAIDLQQRFVEETLEQPEFPLTVGIGLDAGEAVPVQGGYRGAALNLAARLCGQAVAGEILATREVTHLARRTEGARYEDRGSLTFKGITDPVVVVRVVPEDTDPVERMRQFVPAALPPTRTSKRWVVGALIAVGVVLAIVALTRGEGDPGPAGSSPAAAASGLPAGSLAQIDPETGQLGTVIRDLPGLGRDDDIKPNLAIGEGGVWLYAFPDGAATFFLSHFDEETGEEHARLPIPSSSLGGSGLVVGSRTVWFSGADEARVSRINPATHEPLEPVSIDSGVVTDIVMGRAKLWVGSGDGRLTAFDPLTGRRLDKIEIDGTPDALAYSGDSIWVLDSLRGEIIRVDPVTGREVARISAPGNLKDIAAGDGGVWVLDTVAGTATPVNPSSNTAGAPIGVGPAPSDITVGLGSAWVTDGEDGNLYRIDPELRHATQIPLGTPLAIVATDEAGRSVWVGAFADP
jgi:class 3 adenylate cyclase/outer membrane protein assembly factor BamB